MKYFGKRQLVLAGLVSALGIAIYLNGRFAENKNLTLTNNISSSKELGQAQFVNKSNVNSDPNTKEVEEDDGDDSDFADGISGAIKKRETARNKSTEILKEIINNPSSSDSAKQEAVVQAGSIAKNIQEESNVETLLETKGVSKCVVMIHGDECTIVVPTGTVNDTFSRLAIDTVSTQASISREKLKLVEAKKD
ncbi:MAG: SpoIIIAH-like family protein [Oscillospiraceae bacterium]|jgi:stage III sporulation protein AH|nr:SpoIIIAH-like family protein [Oscillospiraceae bacterium]